MLMHVEGNKTTKLLQTPLYSSGCLRRPGRLLASSVVYYHLSSSLPWWVLRIKQSLSWHVNAQNMAHTKTRRCAPRYSFVRDSRAVRCVPKNGTLRLSCLAPTHDRADEFTGEARRVSASCWKCQFTSKVITQVSCVLQLRHQFAERLHCCWPRP